LGRAAFALHIRMCVCVHVHVQAAATEDVPRERGREGCGVVLWYGTFFFIAMEGGRGVVWCGVV
jgi:hypothetical protein